MILYDAVSPKKTALHGTGMYLGAKKPAGNNSQMIPSIFHIQKTAINDKIQKIIAIMGFNIV